MVPNDDQFQPIKSNLRILMAQHKLNITKLEKLADVSRPTISKLQDEIPLSAQLITLAKLAQPLGLEWFDLIDMPGEDNNIPEPEAV